MKKLMIGAAIFSVLSFSSQASLIVTESGGEFDDLVLSTVDLQTGLEWLDLTLTAGRSFDDVNSDIRSDDGVFAKNSWRYATASEMNTLGINWFGLDVSQIVFGFLPNNSERSLETFIQTFGDTLQTYLTSIDYTNIEFDEFGAGFTQGFIDSTELYPNSPVPTRSVAMFWDEEYTFVDTQQRYNGPDILAAQYGVLDTQTGYDDVGSFLVRDFNEEPVFKSETPVSEPQSLAMMLAAMFGLGFLRKKRLSKQ